MNERNCHSIQERKKSLLPGGRKGFVGAPDERTFYRVKVPNAPDSGKR